jgi:hypothetical protein
MPQIEYLSLNIKGHGGTPLPNRFLKQAGRAGGLAVFLPGLNYMCDNPLLYYTANLLVARGVDVLQLWANYAVPEHQSLSKGDQLKWLLDDAGALIAAGRGQRDYGHLILVGKSIGTLTMGALFGQFDSLADASSIWFTPLIRYPFVVEGALHARGKALFLAGTADATYDAGAMARIEAREGARVMVVDDANHSLEIPGDTPHSLDVMKNIVQTVGTFLDKEVFAA